MTRSEMQTVFMRTYVCRYIQWIQRNAMFYKTEMALENVSLTEILFLIWPVAYSHTVRLITEKREVNVELQLPHHTPPRSSPDYSVRLRKPTPSALLLLFSHSVMSDSLQLHGLQHAYLSSPSLLPELAQIHVHWVCDAIQLSSSVIPFSSCSQSFPASGFFPMNHLFTLGGQNIGVSAWASVLPMNIQGWFALGLTGLISLQSKGLSRVFSHTTTQKHQFFGAQPSLWCNSHNHTWLLEKP